MTSPRNRIDTQTYCAEGPLLTALVDRANLTAETRQKISTNAAALVRQIRDRTRPGMMEVFLAEYGLSTDEGVALMCLAEALLRVPDADTIDELIEDKIAPSDWGKHLGHSTSSLVNASTWALMLTGRVLDDPEPGLVGTLRSAVKRLGEPVIRTAVARAMKELGRQFVLGETIQSAMTRAAGMEVKGYTYSYDMLGEAAKTDADARRYHLSYSRAITAIATACTHKDVRANPGISIKLSALHPRYEVAQRDRVMTELVPRIRSLALLAKSANMGLNIDAEEADRLALSIDVIDAVLSEPALADWDGFGIVVQAYGKRAGDVIDHIYRTARSQNRSIMVRLVKGAYWDTEIKRAQVLGLPDFPVFTAKSATDISYIANARKLLGMTDHLYPQFATHNAHSVAAILEMAKDGQPFEFQRLHGMGEALHDIVLSQHKTRCRIYAPVGAHRDLLAYLVRRLLENGANSSFVHQIVDADIAPETVAADPFAQTLPATSLRNGHDLFSPERINSKGYDLTNAETLTALTTQRAPFQSKTYAAAPRIAGTTTPGPTTQIRNPAQLDDIVGTVASASADDIKSALTAALPWQATPETRAQTLTQAADLYEQNAAEIFALLAREAGKTQADAIAELREAVDFLRYYATQITPAPPLGRVTCISPWNFPLAIFTGQIAAALAAGNSVLAKPADQTPLIADFAVTLLHRAGVPATALQLLPGPGATVGAALTANPAINGVVFTGSTATARTIRTNMANHLAPGAPLIAETGGLNAMIVDSTALPEQAVTAIIESAFQSAGQRCSALRCLYVQDDIAAPLLEMLQGAMAELTTADPWHLSTDLGPLIDADAQRKITDHIETARAEGRVLAQTKAPETGNFVPPTLIRLRGIQELAEEVFGPVLHVATFQSHELDQVIDAINATGYGLTFGLQTRIDDRVEHVANRIQAGNIYVNRNQIGAVVGSQPFGGDGLSGTGPKAGGPHYLPRFSAPQSHKATPQTISLPGPTGESNRLSTHARAPLLCLGPGDTLARQQAEAVRALGGQAHSTPDAAPDTLRTAKIAGALWWGDDTQGRAYAQVLAARTGPILPLITGHPDPAHVLVERHICVDTTAAGGNAALLGAPD